MFPSRLSASSFRTYWIMFFIGNASTMVMTNLVNGGYLGARFDTETQDAVAAGTVERWDLWKLPHVTFRIAYNVSMWYIYGLTNRTIHQEKTKQKYTSLIMLLTVYVRERCEWRQASSLIYGTRAANSRAE